MPPTHPIDEKLVFALAPDGQGDGVPLLIIGVPAAAWEYMKYGKTHNLDFTKVGVPLKMMMYGAESHDAAMKIIQDAMKVLKQPYMDMRREDFSIPEKK
jgi:hypothetical protein